jgi:hypothetical protein
VRALWALPAWLLALVCAILPHRYWRRLPIGIPVRSAAFISGLGTLMLGCAIGIPGFLEHAQGTTSLANQALLDNELKHPEEGYNRGMAQGFAGLSIFTFLLLTPKGWITLYLVGSGAVRAGGAWFDDPMGDPILSGIDYALAARGARRRTNDTRRSREALEGPEIPDRVVTPSAAGLTGCDLVIVSSRRKPGWERGAGVFTQSACYRLGEPVERTIAGRLRTLYPLTEHRDFEVVRRTIHYDLPDA